MILLEQSTHGKPLVTVKCIKLKKVFCLTFLKLELHFDPNKMNHFQCVQLH